MRLKVSDRWSQPNILQFLGVSIRQGKALPKGLCQELFLTCLLQQQSKMSLEKKLLLREYMRGKLEKEIG